MYSLKEASYKKVNNKTKEIPILPLGSFIERLKSLGFDIGVDHYLRLQRLLNMTASDIHPLKLKYLLCPIFATDPAQQQIFYREFDLYFRTAEPLSEEAKPLKKESVPLWARKWLYIFIGILLLAIIAFFFIPKTEVKKRAPNLPTMITEPVKTPLAPVKKIKVTIRIPPKPVKPVNPPGFYQQYGVPLYWLIVFFPLVFWVMGELYRYSLRKLALLKQRDKKPPFVWQMQMDSLEPPFFKEQRFYNAARLLRERLESDIFSPDIDKTISATVRKAGFPVICYRALTRPPEYLMLIDLPIFRDHYARFMESAVSALKDEDIFIDRYFYKEDPQVCFREVGGKREYLNDLKVKYANRRLILFGTGENLSDPVTGELEQWTKIFHHWQERAILTPKPVKEWGMQEVMLAADFILLPASLDGLNALGDYFGNPVRFDLRRVAKKEKGNLSFTETNEIEELKKQLGSDTFQWLCACAVYPELHWNLTLYLGLLLDFHTTEESMMKLIRLPWFRSGNMPDELRIGLIRELEPQKLREIRRAILGILEKNPPPEQSGAWDTYRLNLAIHSHDLPRKERKRFKKLMKIRKSISEKQILRDYTLIRVLYASRTSLLNTIIPKQHHKLFFRHGISFFGLKSGIRLIIALILSAVIFFSVSPPVPEQPNGSPPSVRTVAMEFSLIPAGSFMMGSPENEKGRFDREIQHRVTLTKVFYIQTTEVTQGQWEAIMGNNPSFFKNCGDDCPVENISWNDAQAFIGKLNFMKEGRYRLPTEAEWEYAARTGTTTAFANGDITETKCEHDPNLDKMGWYCGNSGVKYGGCYDASGWGGPSCAGTHPVARKQPNSLWGLYDMHGNVWEWCQDSCDWKDGKLITDTYKNGVVDPVNLSGSDRVNRGGGFFNIARYCRSASRYGAPFDDRRNYLGFRLLREVP